MGTGNFLNNSENMEEKKVVCPLLLIIDRRDACPTGAVMAHSSYGSSGAGNGTFALRVLRVLQGYDCNLNLFSVHYHSHLTSRLFWVLL